MLARLRPPDPVGRIVLQGLGGSGKTTVAAEIGHVYHRTGHHVLWIKPVPGRDLTEVTANLADGLKLPAGDAHAVREWLKENADWLMIIDGVDDKETAGKVEQFCRAFPDGHFLITSYLKGYWNSSRRQFTTHDVDVLSTADAHRLLRRLLDQGERPADSQEDTLALTKLLGGLPLAILHADGYLQNNKWESVKTYISKLEAAPLLPEAGQSELRRSLQPVGATWQTSLLRMDPSSRTLLRLLSFLTDDPVPIDLITSPDVAAVFARACATDPLEQQPGRDAHPPDLPDVAVSQKGIWDALTQLLDYCLIQWHDPEPTARTRIRVHRLVLVMTQGSLRPVSAQILPQALEFQRALAAHRKFMAHAIRFLTDYLAREGSSGRTRIYPHLFHLVSLYLDLEEGGSATRAPLALAPGELNFLGEMLLLMDEGGKAAAHFARAAAMPEATVYERAKANQGAGLGLIPGEPDHGSAGALQNRRAGPRGPARRRAARRNPL